MTPFRLLKIRDDILSKRQNRPRENRADGCKDGNGRECAILARLRECRMKAGSPLSATLRRPPRSVVRTDAAPASAREGESLQKDKWILCAESLQLDGKIRPKPRFSPLSTRPGTSLRQEIFVFAARKKFLSAKKSHFCRTETDAEAEKCSIRTVLPSVFYVQTRLIASLPSPARTRNQAENLPF